jgi:hypothetical protein
LGNDREKTGDSEPLIQAVLQDVVCLIGPVRSQIPHNKSFFAVLHDEAATDFLEMEDRSFIRRHVPYTARLNPEGSRHGEAGLSEGRTDYQTRRSLCFIWCCRRSGCFRQEWEKKLEEAAKSHYLIQRYCAVPQLPMLVVEEDQVIFRPFNYLIGCFVYNESFAGPYIRDRQQKHHRERGRVLYSAGVSGGYRLT